MMCKCGCGKEVIIKPYLKNYKSSKYFPKYIPGHWDRGISRTDKEKKNISKSKRGKCCAENSPVWKGGLPKCLVCGKELSNYNNKYCLEHYDRGGLNNPNYKKPEDRITSLRRRIRNLPEMVEWKSQIRGRDNWTCRKCGQKGWMIAHHIKQFSDIMEDNNITTLEEVYDCGELWDINNGITYCKPCHKLLKGKGGLI